MMHTRAVHTTRQARRANVEDQEVRPTSAREASRGLAGARLRERAITRPLFSVCIARARDLHAHEGPFACAQMDSPPMLHGLAERTAPLSSRLVPACVGVAVWWKCDRDRVPARAEPAPSRSSPAAEPAAFARAPASSVRPVGASSCVG